MVNMWIETTSENDTQEVTLTFYVKTQTPWWSLNRFKQIWEILTKGHIEYEADLILNKQSAVNLANTITKSVKDLSTKS